MRIIPYVNSPDSPWLKWLLDAGIISAGENATRVTIDLRVGEVPRITVERFAECEIADFPLPQIDTALVESA